MVNIITQFIGEGFDPIWWIRALTWWWMRYRGTWRTTNTTTDYRKIDPALFQAQFDKGAGSGFTVLRYHSPWLNTMTLPSETFICIKPLKKNGLYKCYNVSHLDHTNIGAVLLKRKTRLAGRLCGIKFESRAEGLG